MKKTVLAMICALFTLVSVQAQAANERFMSVIEKVKLIVGVKAD